jgi:acylpyruvate hydrolase
MKLVTFRHEGIYSVGVVSGESVISLTRALAARLRAAGESRCYERAEALLPNEMIGLLACGEQGLLSAREAVDYVQSGCASGAEARGARGERLLLPLAEVTLLAPVLRPGKIICIALNYRDHAAESTMTLPKLPTMFTKFPSCVIGPGQTLELPEISQQVDWEAELAVVIGRRAKNVAPADALGYVGGYTAFNDVSARDIQLEVSQWCRGKSLDTFAPLGPVLVTSDELPDPGNLDISLRLNGETMQRSNTRYLVFDVPTLVSFFSQSTTLEPGDIIATGTPAGVGHGRKPPVYLKSGDLVEVEIERIGVLENRVI